MRVTYLSASGQMGGAETSLLQLLASVKSSGRDLTLSLVLGEAGPLAVRAEALGIRTTIAPFPPAVASFGDNHFAESSEPRSATLTRASKGLQALAQTRSYIQQLARLLRKLCPDVIHSTGFKMHLLGVWARPSHIPVVWHIHDYVSSRPLTRRLLGWHSRQCAAIIANSQRVRQDILDSCAACQDVTCVYNAIDLERFSPSGPTMDLDAAAKLPRAPAAALKVGLIATFAKWKGHNLFFKAFSLLPPAAPVRAYVIGGPIYQTAGSQFSLEDLQSEVSRLGLNERVGFTGFLDPPDSAMRSLDVVVHASTQPEPFGMVIVEAIACGKVVVASRSCGAAEILLDGKDVLLYPCANPEELAGRIMTLQANPALRMQIARTGRHSVAGVLNGARLAAEVTNVYDRVTAASC